MAWKTLIMKLIPLFKNILITLNSMTAIFAVAFTVQLTLTTNASTTYSSYASGIMKVADDLTNFPVTVVLNSGNFDFDLVQSSGADIFFTDTSDNLLPFEVDYVNVASGIAVYHVLFSGVITSGVENQDILIRYGDVENYFYDFSAGYNPTDVWDENYVLVMHMSGVYNSANPSDSFTPTGITYTTNDTQGRVAVFDGDSGQILLGSGFNLDSYTKLVYFNADSTSPLGNLIMRFFFMAIKFTVVIKVERMERLSVLPLVSGILPLRPTPLTHQRLVPAR